MVASDMDSSAKFERTRLLAALRIVLHSPRPPSALTLSDAFQIVMDEFNPTINAWISKFTAHLCWYDFADREDTVNAIWLKFWPNRTKVNNKTPAGVGAYLKMTTYNLINDLFTQHKNSQSTVLSLDDDETDKLLAEILLAPDLEDQFDINGRLRLFFELFAKAISLLDNEEYIDIILLIRERYSLAEIQTELCKPSLDSVKALRRRALAAVAKNLNILFHHEIKQQNRNAIELGWIRSWLSEYVNNPDDLAKQVSQTVHADGLSLLVFERNNGNSTELVVKLEGPSPGSFWENK